MVPSITQLLRDGLMLALLVSLPIVATALIAGLVVGMLQSVTQLHDPSVAIVPRWIAVAVVLAFSAPWMGKHLVTFAQTAFRAIGAP